MARYLVTVTQIPGSPGSASDRDTICALTSAAGRWRGKRGPLRGPGVVQRFYGRTVIAASRHPAYGESTHTRAYLTHVVDVLYHAWYQGRIVGALVRWACGSMTRWFALGDEPLRQVCPMCLFAIARREATAEGLTVQLEVVA